MTTGGNKAAFRRFIEEVAIRGDLAAIDGLFAPDAAYLLPGRAEPLRGRAAIAEFAAAFRAAFPDYRGAVEEQVAEGDTVVTRVTGRGTHRGAFMGRAPSGQAAAWSVVHITRFVGGRIAEDRVTFDQLTFLQQLGHLTEQPAMATDDNKRIVLRWREEIWNRRNLAVIDELAAPEYVCHVGGLPDPVRGPAALKRLFAAFLAAFDVHLTPALLLAEGDLVAVHDISRLTHTGAFRGHPPTGKEVTVTSTDIYRLAGGRIVEQWIEADRTGIERQLGLLPAPAHGAGLSVGSA
jgi:steroid delta-isomerase-like uncharacterized protein